ncbi:MUSTANG 7 [Hibiscus trionum]|uniref:MUSTANG 7 n=1 Tax=Hibiscus trionum TaxID=183268 RepID=A0A9W7M1P5_HIBTR|nr:MUSTANG 7 [Hibiscus trionum]
MATKGLIVICQSGGEFETEKDGSLSYRGGDAHAIEVDDQMMFDDFKTELTEMFGFSVSTMSIKYFVPGNRNTLITVSDDEDLKRMLKFHVDSITAYVYIVMEEIVAPDVSNMTASRSSRTTLSEEVPPLDQPRVVVNDCIQPNSLLAASVDIVDDTNQIDLPPDIKREYGMDLNYHQAWRAKEIAMEQLQGSYKDVYSQLPFFCDMITETNPGSLATFATKEDSTFHRLFISFHASWSGFVQGCRPLLFLDSTPLKSKYQGMLLTATAADGDDSVFPVAFAVVDAENNDNWHWFLLQLKSAVSTSCSLTFIAARQKGLRESILEIFKGSYHGYCLRYLAEELVRDLKGKFSHEVKSTMIEYLYQAASAPKPEYFRTSVESIKGISLEAYNWIMQSEPQNWANSFFQGARYNHMTSNFGEHFYSRVSDAHELPITRMVDVIRGKIMELIYTRRADSDHWLTRLTPSMEEKLEKESLKVCSLLVLPTTDSIFEVQGESTEVIDMDRCWDCSCKGWQLTGLPCCHAIAVINSNGLNPYDYCSRYFTTERYRLTYAKSVQPIPDVGRSVQKDSSQALVSPPTRCPPGRPKRKL